MRSAEYIVRSLVLDLECKFEIQNEGLFYHSPDTISIFKLA